MNIKNLNALYQIVKAAEPRTVYMYAFHSVSGRCYPGRVCGTAHCLAGFAQLLAGKRENQCSAFSDAVSFLGLSPKQAKKLFYVSISGIWPPFTGWPVRYAKPYNLAMNADDAGRRIFYGRAKKIVLNRLRMFIKTKGRV